MKQRFLTLAALLAALGLIAAACGGGGGDDTLTLGGEGITPIPGNSELVVGPNRFALALIDQDNRPILEEPGTSVLLRFFLGDELKFEQDASFTWAIPDVTGFFAAKVDFDQAGQWQVEPVLTRNGEETVVRRFTFPVQEESQYPDIGDPAPPAANLTLNEEPNIRRLSTDEEPELALYQMTIAEALQAGKPLVIVFATPAFCQTRFCGPVVDNVKAMWQTYGDRVNFIHIEPYELDAEGQLATGAQGGPVVSAPMLEWQLQTEPWVFVVDADGRIAARFEGAASTSELEEVLLQVAG